jgi:hypothetical protein
MMKLECLIKRFGAFCALKEGRKDDEGRKEGR